MSVAFSADGKWLVTGSEDKTARIWNAKTGEPIKTLGGTLEVRQCGLQPDRSFIAATDVGGLTMQRIDSGVMIRLAHFKPRGSRPASTLVYTDDGLFSGDEAAYERVRFRVGKDLGAADMLSADQMFDSFYRPSLMQDFLSGRPLKLRPQVEEGVGLGGFRRHEQTPSQDGPGTGSTPSRHGSRRRGGEFACSSTVRGRAVLGATMAARLAISETYKRFDKDVELLAPGKNIVTAEAYSKLGRIRSRRARRTIVLEGKKIVRPCTCS